MKYINNQKYMVLENYRDGYDEEEVVSKLTDYFDDFDYIIGDWSYGKLRLKGFCKKNNPKLSKINDYDLKDSYIKEECAYNCRYFVLEKVND